MSKQIPLTTELSLSNRIAKHVAEKRECAKQNLMDWAYTYIKSFRNSEVFEATAINHSRRIYNIYVTVKGGSAKENPEALEEAILGLRDGCCITDRWTEDGCFLDQDENAESKYNVTFECDGITFDFTVVRTLEFYD
jgi:hypothetical protein